MRFHRSTAVITLCGAAVIGAGCSGRTAEPSDRAVVPPGLETFYAQSVQWVPCGEGDTVGWFTGETTPGQVCGHVLAPLDYQAARGHGPADTATVSLAVTRRPATGMKEGTLVTISGGPGLPGLPMVEMPFPASVREHFDLVGYDPRGVGRSTPRIDCSNPAGPAPEGSPDPVAAQEQSERELVAACVRGTGLEVLKHIGSDEATNDVDLLRAVLGERRINLLAASYGTQVAAMYATRFPDGYRAAVLDGVVDTAESENDMLLGQQRGYQQTFDRVVAYCTGEYRSDTGAECPLGNEPAAAEESFKQLLRDTDAQPVPATGGAVSAGEILAATTNGLLWRSEWDPYLRALAAVRHGDGTEIRKIAETFSGSENSESGDIPAPRQPVDGAAGKATDPAAITAIMCADFAAPTTDRTARQRDAQARHDAASYDDYLPRPAEFPLGTCDLWPFAGALHPAVPSRPDSAPPLLFVAMRYDPTTPVGNAERMARYLRSPLVVREADGHTFVFADVSSCVDNEVVRYLEDPKSVRDKTCD
ncbi:alpha/beta hydrolase [Nocardia sp. NPDC059240]|uniref:alpha/beta hydrolase n=1 Tax=Nocardia sp. NPDC059240 TaxID=3346786 RepID=UPI0036AFCDB6